MPGVAVKLSAAPIALLHSPLYSDAGRVMTTKAVALLVTVPLPPLPPPPPPPPLEIKSMPIESI